jgi:raffinose/stachyose/melibiose transport system substrate-binding protein
MKNPFSTTPTRRVARYGALALAASLAIGLSACSSGSNSGSTVPLTDKQTLSVVGFEGSEQEPANIKEINAAFEKKYPNIKLDYKFVAPTEFNAYNNTRLAAGTAADVIMTQGDSVQIYAPQGYFSDLSDQPWVKRMIPAVKATSQSEGKTYAFVQQNIPIGLYANLDLLKSVGINEVPTTWNDLVADLKTLKAAGKNGLQAANLNGWGAEHLIQFIAINTIDTLTWTEQYRTGDAHFNPTWVAAFDRARSLLNDGYLDGKTLNGVDEFSTATDQFASGQWAFTIDGAWNLTHYKETAKFGFTLNPFPGGDDADHPYIETYIGSGWAVNAASKRQDAAKAYVAWMTDPEQDTGYLTAQACFSTLKDVPSPAVAEAAPSKEAYEKGDTAPMPDNALFIPDAFTQLRKVVQSMYNDPSQTGEQLADQADKTIIPIEK